MSPRVPKKEREELPKPVVRLGTLGFYPLTNLSLSYLVENRCDRVLGLKDDERTLALKEKPEVSVKSGRKTESIDIKGRFFNGFSDAFYRGQLPQVMVVTLEVEYLDHFFEEFMDHVEKMLSLGFFLRKPNPVDALIPCFVMASNGIFFNNLIAKMEASIEAMKPAEGDLGRQISGKFTRGLLERYYYKPFEPKRAVEIEPPRLMRIAGGKRQTQSAIQTVFSAHGLITSFESSSDNPIERLELGQALRRVIHGVLPYLSEKGLVSKKELQKIRKTLEGAVLEIGRLRKAFEETETLDMVVDLTQEQDDAPAGLDMMAGDLTLLTVLSDYAKHFRMAGAETLFSELKEKVLRETCPTA